MRTKKFHGLKRIKIRQSWAKANLYNLSRLRPQFTLGRTFFQQKWTAKSTARAYHGEQMGEKHWQRMFSPTLRSVVTMDPRYLATCDGSEQAAGRGSGRDKNEKANTPGMSARPVLPTPYMHMTFAPLERRLDTAIFRALFASSTRQARQFVIHGGVKVNGTKMIYPGYLLNPGDMFQVDPDRVMFATGDRKDSGERRATRVHRKSKAKRAKEAEETQEIEEPAESANATETGSTILSEVSETTEADNEAARAANRESQKHSLKDLLKVAKKTLAEKKQELSAKRKQDLRAFNATIRSTIGNLNSMADNTIDEEISNLVSKLSLISPSAKGNSPDLLTTESETTTSEPDQNSKLLTRRDRAALRAALIEARDNPHDASKPYATPWRPRPYMSPFAFIPRYLEVNQRICSAVYLRHPVARAGLAEVPTPFSAETAQLAFNWYLRRR